MESDRVAVGFLETTGYTPAMVALDAMQKHAQISVLQAEINDFLGIVIKISGNVADVESALAVGHQIATTMEGKPVSKGIASPDDRARTAILSGDEYNPLIQQDVVHQVSDSQPAVRQTESKRTKPQSNSRVALVNAPTTEDALGFIETQGFTAVFDAIDTACKAANVQVVGKEKLGGGYVTVVIRGDVAAVNAAVESGKQRVAELGTLIAAHVISRPSESVLALLPTT